MGVNEPLPGQATVAALIEFLEECEPTALVCWDDGVALRPIGSVEVSGRVVVKLQPWQNTSGTGAATSSSS